VFWVWIGRAAQNLATLQVRLDPPHPLGNADHVPASIIVSGADKYLGAHVNVPPITGKCLVVVLNVQHRGGAKLLGIAQARRFSGGFARLGKNRNKMAARIAMIAITTRSSISVKADRTERSVLRVRGAILAECGNHRRCSFREQTLGCTVPKGAGDG
jgi:hypothetical protein